MNRISTSFLALSAAGFIVAILLSYEYLTANFTACYVNDFFSCGAVANSPYSKLFGIPMYLFGLVWFPLLFVLGGYYSSFGSKDMDVFVIFPLLILGDIFTIYLWYDQLVLIGRVCPLCTTLYFINYALTGIAIIATRK